MRNPLYLIIPAPWATSLLSPPPTPPATSLLYPPPGLHHYYTRPLGYIIIIPAPPPSDIYISWSARTLCFFRYYGYLLSTSLSANTRRIAQQSLTCLNIVLNCLVAHHAQAPPIKLPWTRHAPSSAGQSLEVSRERVSCLNMAANAFGYMPLKHSLVRFDPVLYKDNVSMLRKEYRKMEVPSNWVT